MSAYTLLNSLPVDILEAVYDMAGIADYWKRRFSNDVLTQINHGYRLVGLDCYYHYGEVCECPREICSNCYSYGTVGCYHTKWAVVSYEGMIRSRHHSTFMREHMYLPWEVFSYFYPTDDEYMEHGPRSELLHAFQNQLAHKLVKIKKYLVE
ncbi:hypothetical protein PC128_g20053 [Phytophthora cactorum]|nr:hypothetical protein PC120_g24330 [Phytophthora cactorum]KAG3050817.1 hypothetical protein PC121_g18185 [Phytophthora cactorum]KAG3164855.1 hypothetical protein PC128_g20053 [Phytophthora cactorum]KAG4045039.1 hypothetical protein PC123_g19538 [Phytophthora cactorum]